MAIDIIKELEQEEAARLLAGKKIPDFQAGDTVRAAFSAFGEITDVHVVSDRETGQSRGFAFVTMGSAAEARVSSSRAGELTSTSWDSASAARSPNTAR